MHPYHLMPPAEFVAKANFYEWYSLFIDRRRLNRNEQRKPNRPFHCNTPKSKVICLEINVLSDVQSHLLHFKIWIKQNHWMFFCKFSVFVAMQHSSVLQWKWLYSCCFPLCLFVPLLHGSVHVHICTYLYVCLVWIFILFYFFFFLFSLCVRA